MTGDEEYRRHQDHQRLPAAEPMIVKVRGDIVSFLMDAVEHMAKLDDEMRQLRWRCCYRDDWNDWGTGEVKKQCRDLLKALRMVDACAQLPDEVLEGLDDNVINIEEQRLPVIARETSGARWRRIARTKCVDDE